MAQTNAIRAGLASEGAYGLRPQDLRSAYFPGHAPDAPLSEPQTIAIVDAYNNPGAEASLAVYDREFSLPECTSANGCFVQVNQRGETTNLPFPENDQAVGAAETTCKQASSNQTQSESEESAKACAELQEANAWAREITRDIEVTHGVCENCRIRLVEASLPELSDMEAAELTAARPVSEGGEGANEISNSWAVDEPLQDSEAFNHPGIVIIAGAGDSGYLNWTEAEEAHAHGESYYEGVEYPASSPHVIAVGGTELRLNATGSRESETVWNEDPSVTGTNEGADGSGCSLNFPAPSWQRNLPDWSSVGCGTESHSKRAIADISADGDPYTGAAIYDAPPLGEGSWKTFGGTSISAAIIAAMFGLAGGAHDVAYPAQTLYEHLGSAGFYDLTEGANGECHGNYSAGCSGSLEPLSPLDCGKGALICNAGSGYDGPSGVGAPDRIAALVPGTPEESEKQAEGQAIDLPETQDPNVSAGQSTQTAPTGQSALSGGRSSELIRVSGLLLALGAKRTLRHGRPAVMRVAFSFTLSAPTLVRVALAKLVYHQGLRRWQVLRDSLQAAGVTGPNSLRLKAPGRLAPGLYRLSVRLRSGRPRSLIFHIG